MKNEYQENAINKIVGDKHTVKCPKCGYETIEDEKAEKVDENFNETDSRSTKELMEGGNLKKGSRFEER